MNIKNKQLPVGWTVSAIEDIAEVNPRLNKADIPDDLNVSFVPMPAVGAANGSIDVSGERPFVEVYSIIAQRAHELDIQFLVVGATARDLILESAYNIPPLRRTMDIDIGIQ